MALDVFSRALKIDVRMTLGWPCHLIEQRYQLSETQLGHGTYGSVYKALCLNDQRYYALKKMEHIEDKCQLGFPITTLREIKILQGLSHPNILTIKEVVYERSKGQKPPVIYLVLDLMECDLLTLSNSSKVKMKAFRIQHILRDILHGLKYLHQRNIAHRDIKPANILINDQEIVKIADFGLAKKLQKFSTTKVVTLWYRAPELILGLRNYSTKVDIWSIGCLAIELMINRPIFQSQNNQQAVINRIFQLVGTPDRYDIEEEFTKDAKHYAEFKPDYSRDSTLIYNLKLWQPEYEGEMELLDLIEKMLRLNHHTRISAEDALEHPFFQLDWEDRERLFTKAFLQQRRPDQENDEVKKRIKIG